MFSLFALIFAGQDVGWLKYGIWKMQSIETTHRLVYYYVRIRCHIFSVFSKTTSMMF